MISQRMTVRPTMATTVRPGWGLAALAVLVVTVMAWHRTPFGAFQYDDHLNVLRDPATRDPGALVERWVTGFRPLLRTSFFLDRQLWGERAGGFLLSNLAIHVLNALAVMGLARRRGLGAMAAAIAALAFALQPAQTEAVAYVSGRSSSLMTLCLLLGLLAHDHAATSPAAGARVGWLLAGFGAFAAAVSVKEVALVFPLLAWVFLWTSPQRITPRPWLAAHLAGAGVIAMLALRSERLHCSSIRVTRMRSRTTC